MKLPLEWRKLLTGRRKSREKLLRQLLAENLAELDPQVLRKLLQDPRKGAAWLNRWVIGSWKKLNQLQRLTLRAALQKNWDILTQLLKSPQLISRNLLDARPDLRELPEVREGKLDEFIKLALTALSPTLTTMAYDCYCAVCGQPVTPEDYIYFNSQKLPPEYRWAHHECYKKLLEKSKGERG